jgi:predicted lipid-binding transport protein (Tim44 family)
MLSQLAALATRAGGGHSFSGGGSHSSSGGSSGGGGVFFFGGGGGGGGGIAGFIILIVIVLIIVGVYMAVKRNRGGISSATDAATRGYGGTGGPGGPSTNLTGGGTAPWSGSGGDPAINSIRGDVFPGTHADAHAAQSPVEQGLTEITAHDPAFNQETFLEDVNKAFFVVQEAWEQRKPDMSRQVMADGIWQQHRAQIQGYLDEHKHNVLEDLAVGDLRVLSAHSDQTYDTITVRVTAACADYDVDDEKGKVIRGNKSVEQWQEDWTFQRSSEATTKAEGGTLRGNKCPNCGAPFDVDLQGICKYRHAPIMSGKYDWVLARINQVM